MLITIPDRGRAPDPQVELRVDAEAPWLPAVRLLAGDLATRADFDLDAVADLRLAVDEACAELVRAARPGSTLTCTFAVRDDRITVTAAVPVVGTARLDKEGFGWRVLTTLADDVEILVDEAALAQSPALGLRLETMRRAETR